MAHLEHVNITVADPKRTAAVLMDLFDWHIRWEGPFIQALIPNRRFLTLTRVIRRCVV